MVPPLAHLLATSRRLASKLVPLTVCPLQPPPYFPMYTPLQTRPATLCRLPPAPHLTSAAVCWAGLVLAAWPPRELGSVGPEKAPGEVAQWSADVSGTAGGGAPLVFSETLAENSSLVADLTFSSVGLEGGSQERGGAGGGVSPASWRLVVTSRSSGTPAARQARDTHMIVAIWQGSAQGGDFVWDGRRQVARVESQTDPCYPILSNQEESPQSRR